MPERPEAFTVAHQPLEYGDQFVVGAPDGAPHDAVTILMHDREFATVARIVPDPARPNLGGEVTFSPPVHDAARRQEIAVALAGALHTVREIAQRTN